MAILLDIDSDIGKFVSKRNLGRQYDFLQTAFTVSEYGAGLEIDHEFICSLNMYATQYVSLQPGRYRRHYDVEVGPYRPRDWMHVLDEMDEFLDFLHRQWAKMDELQVAAYALWGINNIHPFSDGNGRTSRALCYFVLCKKLKRWLPGKLTVPEIIRTQRRDEYCEILNHMHAAKGPGITTDLSEMTAFLNDVVLQQVRAARAA